MELHHFVIRIYLFILLMLVSAQSLAWGPLGHKAACDAAWRASNEALQQQLAAVARRMGYKTYAESCLWPDRIRDQKNHRWTKPLHYMNLPRRASEVGDGDCIWSNKGNKKVNNKVNSNVKKPRCVGQAIDYFVARWANPRLSQQQRDEALLFLSHFIVDMHQPLHVAYADDRGGTRRNVVFQGKLLSLHRLWDNEILYCGYKSSWRKLGKQLYRRVGRYGGSVSASMYWADESFALTRTIYANLQKQLPDDYCQRFHPLAIQRLELASMRLAEILAENQ